jgi:cation transport protein ChaC
MRSLSISSSQAGDPDAWVFAYGSLLWDPVFESDESRVAIARGWHRSFCFWVKRGRGTLDRPGLMMALDRGGHCRGMAFRLRRDTLREDVERLLRREVITKPWINLPRMLRLTELPPVSTGHLA